MDWPRREHISSPADVAALLLFNYIAAGFLATTKANKALFQEAERRWCAVMLRFTETLRLRQLPPPHDTSNPALVRPICSLADRWPLTALIDFCGKGMQPQSAKSPQSASPWQPCAHLDKYCMSAASICRASEYGMRTDAHLLSPTYSTLNNEKVDWKGGF